ncbi:MAG: NEW3 domain-containing protein [Bacteroidota bacterium]|jgi:uncharacterized membrane protein
MERFFMPLRTWLANSILFAFALSPLTALSAPDLILYTPYKGISVSPGQSIDYNIDVINKASGVRDATLVVRGLPKDWTYELKSGGWVLETLSVLPDEKRAVTLKVNVPLKVKKGVYRFSVVAGSAVLPLKVTVEEEGTFRSELTTQRPNMEGNSNSTFTFTADLRNVTADEQLYALRSNAERGWNVSFKADGRQVSSVKVGPNQRQSITIEVDPPDVIEAKSYKIPIIASSSSTSAELELEVVIKGSYAMELTTPTGLLSTGITAGKTRRVELTVINKGSAPLTNVKLNHSAPINWDVTFEPASIDRLEPGEQAQVFATISADEKAIAGDYVVTMESKTPEVSSKATFRVSVKTPILYGWLGILVIGGALGGVYTLFRKYGRR